ncbi:trypsin-like serine peptidase [Chondromyces apiculatus]|uniref:Serine protease n=1 Tax=Chondromyces apiculatus DSM 436 TaxID=1192034 RepID=A0A017SVV5_9BACT|nr:serine protease [Chondromyces apiculatus]EYF00907.1 Hypothetical protein CAP_8924 [Chondromyces apiculatus DSM 436]
MRDRAEATARPVEGSGRDCGVVGRRWGRWAVGAALALVAAGCNEGKPDDSHAHTQGASKTIETAEAHLEAPPTPGGNEKMTNKSMFVRWDQDDRETSHRLLRILKHMRAVALITRREDHTKTGQTLTLTMVRRAPRDMFCDDTTVLNLPRVQNACTGFLVRKNILATARHCVDEGKWRNKVAIFGYATKESDYPPTSFDLNNDVYELIPLEPEGAELEKDAGQKLHEDWALLRLSRVVPGVDPLVVLPKADVRARSQEYRGDSVHTIGHPLGLPVVYSGKSTVLLMENDSATFRAGIDGLIGNSGSPVFNWRGEVIGMYVDGDDDLKGRPPRPRRQCIRELQCTWNGTSMVPAPACNGEIILKSDVFFGSIPAH